VVVGVSVVFGRVHCCGRGCGDVVSRIGVELCRYRGELAAPCVVRVSGGTLRIHDEVHGAAKSRLFVVTDLHVLSTGAVEGA
jgi:hypothetical protein